MRWELWRSIALINSFKISNQECRKGFIIRIFDDERYTLEGAQARLQYWFPQDTVFGQVIRQRYSSKEAFRDELIRVLDAEQEHTYNVEIEKVLLATPVVGLTFGLASRALASPNTPLSVGCAYSAVALGTLATAYYAPETLNWKNLAGVATGFAASGLGYHPAVATCAGLGTALLTRMPVVHEAVRGAGRLAERTTYRTLDAVDQAIHATGRGIERVAVYGVNTVERFGWWTICKLHGAAQGIGSMLKRANSAFDEAALALSQTLRGPCSEEHLIIRDSQGSLEVHNRSWR